MEFWFRCPPPDANLHNLDRKSLRQIIEGVEEGLAARDLELDNEKKSNLIALLYEHFTNSDKKEVDTKILEDFLLLVT